MKECTEAQFLKDVEKHTLDIRLDHVAYSGAYRHLYFMNPTENSWNQWFEIVTWPGTLEIHGDMGTWSFSRVDDMFRFFRQDRAGALSINPSYWGEKINAESRNEGPHRKFDKDTFHASIISHLDNYDLEPERKAEIITALKQDVFDRYDDEIGLRNALEDFKCEGFTFSDICEIDGRVYPYHFIWCLYAIVWGIQRYDDVKVNQVL